MSSVADDRAVFVDRDAERFILGACLDFRGVFPKFAVLLKPEWFFSLHHQLVWRAMERATDQGLDVSWPSVRTLLDEAGHLEEVTAAYLSGLVDGVPRPDDSSIFVHANRLRDCHAARMFLRVQDRARRDLEADPGLLQRGFLDALARELTAIESTVRARQIPAHVASLGEVMTEIAAAFAAGPPTFIETPWSDLNDYLAGGFVPGELITLGARPGLGKTAAALEISRRAARQGHPVLFISREMLRTHLGVRLIAQEGKVDASALRRHRLSLDQHTATDQAMARLSTLPIFITHAAMRIDALRELVAACQQETRLGLLVVDYLQLIDAPPHIKDRRLQVEAVSSGLKKIALEFQLPVLCLSSLSRPSDARSEPSLASLRESGNIEHDSDTVLLMHRQTDTDPVTDLIVAKARSARSGGRVQLLFKKEFLRFDQVSSRTEYGA